MSTAQGVPPFEIDTLFDVSRAPLKRTFAAKYKV